MVGTDGRDHSLPDGMVYGFAEALNGVRGHWTRSRLSTSPGPLLARVLHDHYRYYRLELRLACRGDIYDRGMDPSVFFSQRCWQAMADDARG